MFFTLIMGENPRLWPPQWRRTEWIQNHAQIQPPGGQAGIRSGTWKSVKRYHTQVWLTLNTVKSSGWTSETLDLYVIASAQPLRSSKPVVWMAAMGEPGHG